jgi:hypothetical protein
MRIRPVHLAVLALALLLVRMGIGLAIPRAAHLARSEDRRPTVDSSAPASPGRDVYSADIRNDAHVRREQRKLVEMLERQCRTSRENCDVARAARAALEAD